MKIKTKIGILFFILVLFYFIGNLLFLKITNSFLNDNFNNLTKSLSNEADEKIKGQLENITNQISESILTIENQVDVSMLNAAYALQEMDAQKELTEGELKNICTQLGMSDLYLTDANGIFTVSTEKAAIGLSLFSIWDGYKMLLEGKAEVLPSTLKIKEETGQIFKFTAIARKDQKGIIEAALDSKVVEQALNMYVDNNNSNGITSIEIVDSTGMVLTQNLKSGAASEWTKGKQIDNAIVKQIFKDGKTVMSYDNQKGDLFAPVLYEDQVRYVMHVVVDTSLYYQNIAVVQKSLETSKDRVSFNMILSTGILFILLILFILILFMFLNSVLKSINRFGLVLNSIGSENKNSLEDIKVKDVELVKIKKGIQSVTKSYEEMINSIKTSIINVSDLQEEYSGNMNYAFDTIKQISTSTSEMASNNEKEIAQVDEITKVMSQMSNALTIVNTATDNLQEMYHSTHEYVKTSDEGLNNITHALGSIETEVESNHNKFKQLAANSNELSGIISFINNVTSQTNLLALNASIEAARAGEAGKGFTVVAEQIRKLANDSSSATGKIVEILGKIMEDIELTTTGNEKQLSVINRNKLEIDSAKESLKTLINFTIKSGEQVNQVISNVDLLKQSEKIVEEVVEKVNYAIESNAASSEELQATIESLTTSMEYLSKSLNRITDEINKLESL